MPQTKPCSVVTIAGTRLFDQPDPYDGSYNLTDPQSFNRYAYVQNDPVNFVDPSGLDDRPATLPPPRPTLPPFYVTSKKARTGVRPPILRF
jgi:hypothetical protein